MKSDGHEARVREKTGLVIDAYFSGTKIAWILDHVEGARARAEKGELAFGTIDAFLIWKLTGGGSHVTDVTNASRTLLMDLATLDWHEPSLEAIGVPRSLLVRSAVRVLAEVVDVQRAQRVGDLARARSHRVGDQC